MEPVIYIDVLVVLNIIITFLLLLASSRLMHSAASPGRYIAGSFLGGAFSLVILAPDMGFVLSSAVKLIFSLIIILIVYEPKTIRNIFRTVGFFFLVNFIFAGIMLFISSVVSSELMKFNNGIVYVNFSFLSLIFSSVLCYFIVCLLNKFTERKARGERFFVRIENGAAFVEGTAFLDTGNSLRDPFTGEAVVIADAVFLKDILPSDVSLFLEGNEEHCGGIKLIPFSSVASKGLLPCFRTDRLYVKSEDREYELIRPIVAVSGEKLNGHDVLLSPEILLNNERKKEKCC